MEKKLDGNAIVYCQNAFNTPNGKTAHGLVRFTHRYNVLGVIDSNYTGEDAGEVLDGVSNDIPIFESFNHAYKSITGQGISIDYFVIGLAPDGGRLPLEAKGDIKAALEKGINIASGLHDFISNDPEMVSIANAKGLTIKDVRKTPDRKDLHFFTGDIEKVESLKIAVLGTDSAIGKRTTAWLLVHGLQNAGISAEMIGTGQTAWMQGAKYSMIMDSCINDFVSGEIEHAIVSAWNEKKPRVVVIEGQGSLMNPAYPGGFEILAAGRPDYVILQHAPTRKEYDGFPGYPLHDINTQIDALKVISGKDVIAITLNHEGLKSEEIANACKEVTAETGLPCFDVLAHSVTPLVELIKGKLNS